MMMMMMIVIIITVIKNIFLKEKIAANSSLEFSPSCAVPEQGSRQVTTPRYLLPEGKNHQLHNKECSRKKSFKSVLIFARRMN